MTNRCKKAGSVLVATAIVLAGCGSSDEAALASGESFDWNSAEGQWIAVNYWAEWCKPCYEEIPELNALDQDPRVRVLGVNYDGVSGAELESLIDRMGIRFSTLLDDPAERFDWQQPAGLPATFVINPEGEVVEALFGAQTRDDLLEVISGQATASGPE